MNLPSGSTTSTQGGDQASITWALQTSLSKRLQGLAHFSGAPFKRHREHSVYSWHTVDENEDVTVLGVVEEKVLL